MPQQEVSHRFQRCLMWDIGGYNTFAEIVRTDPIELIVRWEDDQKEDVKPDGTPIVLDANVHVDTDLKIGATMWLAPDNRYSALEQWLGTGSVAAETEIMEVVTWHSTPDIRNRVRRRTAGLVKYRHDLPEEAP